MRNNRHPAGSARRRSRARCAARCRRSRVRGDLGDLREHRFSSVDRVLVIDENDAGATDDELMLGALLSAPAARKVDVVLEFGDDKRLDEPEFIDHAPVTSSPERR
jgi:hypothetical protein